MPKNIVDDKVIKTPPIKISSYFGLPGSMDEEIFQDKSLPRSSSVAERGLGTGEVIGPILFDPDSGYLMPPLNLRVVQQRIYYTEEGIQMVEATFTADSVAGATEYEIRIASEG